MLICVQPRLRSACHIQKDLLIKKLPHYLRHFSLYGAMSSCAVSCLKAKLY